MATSKVEFDITTGKVTIGPGELEYGALSRFSGEDRTGAEFADPARRTIKSIEFTGPVTAPQDCSGLFQNMTALEEIKGLENLDTSQTIDMRCMFDNCTLLEDLDLLLFGTSNVENMEAMFLGCSSLSELLLPGWDVRKVKDFASMFQECTNLMVLDISTWELDAVEDCSEMFADCSSLVGLTMPKLHADRPIAINEMFSECVAFEDISDFLDETMCMYNTEDYTYAIPKAWESEFKIVSSDDGLSTTIMLGDKVLSESKIEL